MGNHKGCPYNNRRLPVEFLDRMAKKKKLPPGMKLLCTLEGHQSAVLSVAFDPQGGILASGSEDKSVKLWEALSGKLLRTLEGHKDPVFSVAFDPKGGMLASGSKDQTVKLWEARSGKLLRTLEGHKSLVYCVAFDPQGGILASGSGDKTVKLWEARSGKLLHTLEGHQKAVLGVAFDPQDRTLASGGPDETVKVWEARSGKLLRTLEGHTYFVESVAFSSDGRLLASKSADQTIRLWSCETWETVAVIPLTTNPLWIIASLVFHPTLPLLAAAGSKPHTPYEKRCRLVHLWELDFDVLLGRRAGMAAAAGAVHHTTGKIVLVGDHSVGKSALGYRLTTAVSRSRSPRTGSSSGCFPTWASAARTARTARRSSGTSRASPTTGWSTRSSWTTPISR
jgi:WD40 repeat protein